MFERVKEALCGEPLLFTPNFSLPFILQTDASDRGLGAVLTQQVEGVDRPMLYISRKLTQRESKYSTVEKECLAIRWAVGSLRYYLLGRPFTLCSDHAPLQWLGGIWPYSPLTSRWFIGRGRGWWWLTFFLTRGGGGGGLVVGRRAPRSKSGGGGMWWWGGVLGAAAGKGLNTQLPGDCYLS